VTAEEKTPAAHACEQTRKLEAVFSKIERERMLGIPILNPGLQVAAIGMRPFGESWVCALVTPWFINLMLVPQTMEVAEAWNRMGLGTKVKHEFPAGTFEFICGTDEGLGPYRMCSLFSPVLEFENQEAALATAEAALGALFDESLDAAREPESEAASVPPKKDAGQVSRRNLLFGTKAARP
jgi:[NiFe] hydrogenase assembly HybE family chaperone